MMRRLHKLTNIVEKKISKVLPDIIALVFDGCTCGDTHFLALFATYPSDLLLVYQQILLGFAPLGEKQSVDAKSHYDYIKVVLEGFSKTDDKL